MRHGVGMLHSVSVGVTYSGEWLMGKRHGKVSVLCYLSVLFIFVSVTAIMQLLLTFIFPSVCRFIHSYSRHITWKVVDRPQRSFLGEFILNPQRFVKKFLLRTVQVGELLCTAWTILLRDVSVSTCLSCWQGIAHKNVGDVLHMQSAVTERCTWNLYHIVRTVPFDIRQPGQQVVTGSSSLVPHRSLVKNLHI